MIFLIPLFRSSRALRFLFALLFGVFILSMGFLNAAQLNSTTQKGSHRVHHHSD